MFFPFPPNVTSGKLPFSICGKCLSNGAGARRDGLFNPGSAHSYSNECVWTFSPGYESIKLSHLLHLKLDIIGF